MHVLTVEFGLVPGREEFFWALMVQIAGDAQGFVIFGRDRRAGQSALEDQEVRRLFRDLAAAAGVKLARPPSGHSTRVGAAQDMIAARLELGEVMQAGSWKTVTMPARYSERLPARRGAARRASSPH